LDRSGLVDEIKIARQDLEQLAQCEVRWFRPPYGAQNLRTLAMVRSSGMKTLLWSVDSRDWKGLGGDDPLSGATAGLAPGGILLMHDTPVGDNESDDLAHGYVPKDELTRLYLHEFDRLGLEAVSLDGLASSGRWRRRARLG
jgi:peptidoglycan/xylan/chitin deacetylase (PgdA/CDA1 family)